MDESYFVNTLIIFIGEQLFSIDVVLFRSFFQPSFATNIRISTANKASIPHLFINIDSGKFILRCGNSCTCTILVVSCGCDDVRLFKTGTSFTAIATVYCRIQIAFPNSCTEKLKCLFFVFLNVFSTAA